MGQASGCSYTDGWLFHRWLGHGCFQIILRRSLTVRIRIPQMVSRTICSDYPGAIESLNSRLATSLLWNVNSNKA